jgi:DNA polymerase III alpha subunit (gram-positive type)
MYILLQIMGKSSGEEVLYRNMYVNLSAEAEALKVRAEANESRLESILEKVKPPHPPPRPSVVPGPSGTASAPPSSEVSPQKPQRPPKPEILKSKHNKIIYPNIMTEVEKLRHVERLNQDWQEYNEQREAFVLDLTRRHHAATNELRAKNEEICRSQAAQMKSNLRIEQLEIENEKIKSELNEMSNSEQKLERISVLYTVTKNKNQDLENDLNFMNVKLAKLEAVNEKLLRTIRKDRRRTDISAIQIDRSISQLTEKIEKLSNSGSNETFASLQLSPVDRSPRKKTEKIVSCIKPSNKRQSIENTEISCENCGKRFPVTASHQLLAHLDYCEES